MGTMRGRVETIISLSKNTCYFMKTGKCSLNVIKDFSVSDLTVPAMDELLYCPRLLQTMRAADKPPVVSVIPCECGHAEVVNGHQKACIAEQMDLELEFVDAEQDEKAACSLCEGQLSFDGGVIGRRIVSVRALIDMGGKTERKD